MHKYDNDMPDSRDPWLQAWRQQLEGAEAPVPEDLWERIEVCLEQEAAERDPWSDAWRQQLEGAEVPVPAHLWDGIAARLDEQPRRRSLWLSPWVGRAAAVLLLACGSGAWMWHQRQQDLQGQQSLAGIALPASSPIIKEEVLPADVAVVVPARNEGAPTAQKADVAAASAILPSSAPSLPTSSAAVPQAVALRSAAPSDIAADLEGTPTVAMMAAGEEASVPALASVQTGGPVSGARLFSAAAAPRRAHIAANMPQDDAQLRAEGLQLAALPQRPDVRGLQSEWRLQQQREQQAQWAQHLYAQQRDGEGRGLSFYAGMVAGAQRFDPNYQLDAPALAARDQFMRMFVTQAGAVADPALSEVQMGEQMSGRMSMGVGVKGGLRLGKHWKLESGLQYGHLQAGSHSEIGLVDMRTGSERAAFFAAGAESLPDALYAMRQGDYSLHADYRMLSVPLQMGYDARWGRWVLGLKAGLSADCLLEARVSGPGLEGDMLEQGLHRPVGVSALLTPEVAYVLGPKVQLTLEGQWRQGLGDGAALQGVRTAGNTLGVQMGLSYGF